MGLDFVALYIKTQVLIFKIFNTLVIIYLYLDYMTQMITYPIQGMLMAERTYSIMYSL